MTVTIGSPLAAFGIFLGILISLGTIFAFLGSSIWRTKKDDHVFRSDLAAQIGRMQTDITRHDERLREGERSMSRIEGISLANSATLASVSAQVARFEGMLAGRPERRESA